MFGILTYMIIQILQASSICGMTPTCFMPCKNIILTASNTFFVNWAELFLIVEIDH